MKKLSIFLMLMAFLAPLAMNGQNRSTLFVYENATGTNEYAPVYGYWADAYQKCEFVIPASQLTNMSGGAVSQMVFYLSSAPSKSWGGNFQVFLKEVSSTSISAFEGTTGATIVYNSSVDASSGTMTVTFGTGSGTSSTYLYNGGNLLVGVYETSKGSYSSATFTGESVSGACVQGYNSSSLSSVSATQRNFIPKTQFTYSKDPIIALSPAAVTIKTGLTETLTASYANVTGTPTITYSSSAPNVASVIGNGTTATVTGVTAGTATISASLTENGTTITATCAVTVEDPSLCTPTFTGSTTTYYISNFTTTGATTNINNTTSGTGLSYSNYYDTHSASAYEGQTIDFTITIAGGSTHGSAIWVDWNNDLEFSDAERVHQTSGYASSPHSGSFTVPTGATLGDHHMRIVTDYLGSSPSNPCSASTGEFEDYKLTVIAAPNCMPPTGLAVVGTPTAHGVAVEWNAAVGETFNYDIELGTGIDPTTVTYQGSITATSTTCSMSWNNLTNADSDYTVFIRKDCGNGEYSTAATKIIHTEIACPAPNGLTGTPDGLNAILTWTDTGAQSYEVVYATSTTADPNNLPIDGTASTNSYTKSNLAIDNDYYFWVRANCGGEGYSTWAGPVSVHIGYCVPSFGSNTDCITNFTLGDINNTTASSSTLGYGNYTNLSTSLEPGVTATASLTSGDGSGTHAAAVWIDFNDNLVFESSEKVGTQDNIGASATVNITLSIPNDAAVGSHRLRVVYQYNTAATSIDPCASATYGEAEDYTVNIVTVTCPAPTNLTATNVMPTSATLNWNGDAESYNVRYKIAASDTPAFSDDFETGLSNWTTVDADGDGFNWASHINTGSGNYTTHSGDGVAYSESYDNNGGTVLYPDNWLITPQVQLGGSVSFWAMGQDASYAAEHFAIYVSTTGNNPSNFTQISQEYIATGEYVNYSASLSNYSGMGYVAIRHFNVSDQFILNIDDFEIYGPNEWITVNNVNGNSLDITGLTSLTNYVFQVQAVCGTDGESNWSAIATFTTPDACAVPTGLTAEVTGNAAELSWTGTTETYNLQYCEVDPTVPATIILNIPSDVWGDGSGYQMLIDADATAYGTIIPETGGLTSSGDASAETYAEFEYKLPTNADGSCSTSNILVEGSLSIEIPAGTYDWCITNPTPDDRVWIASSNGNVGGRQDDYVFEPGTTYEFTIHVSGSNDAVDVTITDNNEWTLVEGVNNPYTIENLSAQTTYKYKVQGVDCDGNGNNTNWSASATFTTGEFYTKTIEAYEGDGGYYLIASPLVNNVAPTDVTGMITDNLGANVDETTSTYDLYSFDQAQELEWRNYRASSNFSLVNGQGYLYASKEGTELVFTGAGNTGNTQDVTLYMTDQATGLDFPDWNLVGNPFAKDNAYLSDGRAFYSMQNSGVYTPQLGPVAIGPMEGVFVVANSNEETLTFTTTQPNKKVAQLTLNLTKSASAGSTLLDRAIVSFDEGSQLPKLQFRNGSTKVYMPMDGKEYAIVSAEAMGTMPVNFKAENNGSYTLSVNAEDVNFAYLHLIDNMNGNDVDLLANPSYSFEAKTTDYESRFKLVFATGNSNDDTFAFYSNGSFVINNEGNATLQVIDVNGRILKSESINGCANVNVNAAQGIYMLRLVNGNDVKVQKVVVR